MANFDEIFRTSPAHATAPDARAGLCLSGGGFRAMVFHVGGLRRLFEVGALPHLDRISSVSGGSIAAAQLALGWPKLMTAEGDVQAFVETVQRPLLDLAGKHVDVVAGGRGLLTPRRSVAQSVAAAYRRHLLGDATLADLPDTPRFVFCATNLGSGSLLRFAKPYTADYRIGKRDGLVLDLADVVAASAAFPPMLSPMVIELGPDQALTESFVQAPGGEEPVLAGVDPYPRRLELSDGGVYDNLGLQPIEQCRTILASDGGGPFEYDPDVPVNWLQQMVRAWKVTDNQVRALRRSHLVDEYRSGVRNGAFWSIQTRYSEHPRHDIAVDDQWSRTLMSIGTRLTKIPREQREQLTNWGYCVCDAALRSFVSNDLDPAILPFPDQPLAAPPPAGGAWWKFWK